MRLPAWLRRRRAAAARVPPVERPCVTELDDRNELVRSAGFRCGVCGSAVESNLFFVLGVDIVRDVIIRCTRSGCHAYVGTYNPTSGAQHVADLETAERSQDAASRTIAAAAPSNDAV